MVDAYQKTDGVVSAIEMVKKKCPDCDDIILEAMWRSIDAYIDCEMFKSNFENQ